jgi:hypothetical protein
MATTTIFVVESTTAAISGGASNLTINVPSGCQAGDILIAQIVSFRYYYGAPITLPSNWTLLSDGGGNYSRFNYYTYVDICWKAFSPGETSYTWLCSNVDAASGSIIALRGCNPTNPIDAYSSNASSSGSTVIGTSISLSRAGCMLLFFCSDYYSTPRNFSTASGMSEKFDLGSSACGNACDYELRATDGSTGDRSSTISGSVAAWWGFMVGVMPIVDDSIRVINTATASNLGANLTINNPSGTVNGDFLIAWVAATAAATPSITDPSGWATIGTDIVESNKFIRYHAAWKSASSEPSSWQWTSNSGDIIGGVITVRGCDASPIDVHSSHTDDGTYEAYILASGVTTSVDSCALVGLFNEGSWNSTKRGFADTLQMVMEWRVESTHMNNTCSFSVKDSAGFTGDKQAKLTGWPTAWGAKLIALKPGALVNPQSGSDTGQGTEGLKVGKTFKLADTGHGAEAVWAGPRGAGIADYGHGADNIRLGLTKRPVDSAQGSDDVLIHKKFPTPVLGLPLFDISNFSIGPAILYLGVGGAEPLIDMGAVYDSTFKVTSSPVSFYEGFPSHKKETYNEKYEAVLTVKGIEWNLATIRKALSGYLQQRGDVYSYFGTPTIDDPISVRLVHITPSGIAITIDLFRARPSNILDAAFGYSVHTFTYAFNAIAATQDFDGNILPYGTSFKITLDRTGVESE